MQTATRKRWWVVALAGVTLAAGGGWVLWRMGHDEFATLRGHEGPVCCVAYAPDGATLASGGHDRVVRLWDAVALRERAALAGHGGRVWAVAFAPDGRTLASASQDRTVRLWDVAAGKEVRVLRGHRAGVRSLAFSPDGATLASGSDDKGIRLWDVAAGKERRVLKGHGADVSALAFTPDGKTLISASCDHTVRFWDVATGEERGRVAGPRGHVTGMALTPDGAALACSGGGVVQLVDVHARRELHVWRPMAHLLSAPAFSADGRTLVVGSENSYVLVWDVAGRQERARLRGHSGPLVVMACAPDGETVASSSGDGTVKLWKLPPMP